MTGVNTKLDGSIHPLKIRRFAVGVNDSIDERKSKENISVN